MRRPPTSGRRSRRLTPWLLALALAPAGAATPPGTVTRPPARLAAEELVLANGMHVVLVPRRRGGTVVAGWVARVGSADEPASASGASHLLEHLLFKGTRVVGARDPELEAELLAEMDRVDAELLELGGRDGPRAERRRRALTARSEELAREARSTTFLGELSLLYSEAGAVGLNAHTLEDASFFYVTLPAERLELWFWLESDRLLDPVFREFHKEKRVVAEERRLRIGSTPTGAADERVRAAFWGDSPYARLPLGRSGGLDRLSRPDLYEFFRAHYRAPRLTAVLVGDFDTARARELAARYFGRLPGGGPSAVRDSAAAAVRAAEERIEVRCDCPPQARVFYPTVPFRHPDSYALQLLSGVLNGRSGRLYRSLVLEQEIAFSASARQAGRAVAGHFTLEAEVRGDATPEQLVAAWDRELARLATEPVPADELSRVRNRITADAYRRLKDPGQLLTQLLVYEGLGVEAGGWREIDDWPQRILAVTAEELRAAARSLGAQRRLVALYRRAGEGGSSVP